MVSLLDVCYVDMKFWFKRQQSTDWVESSFLFERATGKQPAAPQGEGFIGSSFTIKKMVGFFVAIGLLLSVLFARIIFLQFVHGDEYHSLAEKNRGRAVPISAERGTIYDRNGIPLTKNVPNFSLAVVPQDLPRKTAEREAVIKRLSTITGKEAGEIRSLLETYQSYRFESIVITDDIAYDQALQILINASDLPGISIHRGSKRLYVSDLPEAFSHILGYVGKISKDELDKKYSDGYLPSDSIGKTGIEKSYESSLRGVYGERRVEVNAMGREQSVLSEEAPAPGEHITLSIDAKMQTALYNILKRGLQTAGKKRGSAIVLDPMSGEVLAIVSIPSFNNNDFSGGIDAETYNTYVNNTDEPLFSRALSGTYPSGSSIKPAIAAAALAEGIITSMTSFLSTGGIQIGQWFFPDWLPGGHGVTDVRKSLAWSVNTFYYYIGGGYKNFVGLGVEKMTSYLARFGFGSRLGIDLPGEASGFLPSEAWKETHKKEQWYIGDTYNLSIGQGDLLVTPLQIAGMTAAIANGGTLYRPHVAKEITFPLTKSIQAIEPVVLNPSVVPEEYLSIVKLGMRDCVTVGSCHQLADLPFAAAGKTGTAQWSTGRSPHAWFTSFAPFSSPAITITVIIEEGGEGGIVAQPVAKEFYEWWWAHIPHV